MKQIWIIAAGGPENLQLRETPDLQPRAGELRIKVRASGINFADILARKGLYPDAPRLPAVVGYEVSGTVDVVGPQALQGFLASVDQMIARRTHVIGGVSRAESGLR